MAQVFPSIEETYVIDKFKLRKEIIWQKKPAESVVPSLIGVKTITVGSLINGETYTCSDINEILQFKEHIIQTAKGLKVMVDAAADFEGDTIIEL